MPGFRLGRVVEDALVRASAVAAIAIAMAVVPLTARAVQPDEVLKDRHLEERARHISTDLRCLVCQNQSIDDSDAPLAKDLRLLVRERLVAGDTDDAVRRFVVQRYGEFVLLKPVFGLHTALLWLAPLLVFAAGAVGALRTFRRRRAALPATLSMEERSALDELLRGRDG